MWWGYLHMHKYTFKLFNVHFFFELFTLPENLVIYTCIYTFKLFNVHFLFELFTLPENISSHVQCSFPFWTIYPSREPQFTCSMFISFLNYLPFQRTWLFTHVYTHLNCSMFISFLNYLPFQRTSVHMFNVHFLFELFTFQRTWLFTHVYTHLNCLMFISFLNYLPFQRTSVHMFNVHFLFELITLPENLSSHVQCSFPFWTIYPSRESGYLHMYIHI